MSAPAAPGALERITPGPGRLSIGVELPLDNDWSIAGRAASLGHRRAGEPDLAAHRERAELAERCGFAALWLRDVPLYDPSFGDAGQVFEPFTYLGYLAAATQNIVLGTAAIALPLRHPLHVAKMAATTHWLTGGRLVLGVASGDRPREFPAFGVERETRQDLMREHLERVRTALARPIDPAAGLEVLPHPKPGETIPMISAGRGGQSIAWLAEHLDGYMTYHRPAAEMAPVADQWHRAVAEADRPFKPIMTTMLVDLVDDPRASVRPMRFGAHLGRDQLVAYLRALESAGVNHVAINLRPSHHPVEDVLVEISEHVLPHFAAREVAATKA